jgi:hypothetical protein
MHQLVTDRALLRRMREEAERKRNYVEVHFCDALLATVREILPDNCEPTGFDLKATVILREAEEAPPPPDATEEFITALAGLVDALKVQSPHNTANLSTMLRWSTPHMAHNAAMEHSVL